MLTLALMLTGLLPAGNELNTENKVKRNANLRFPHGCLGEKLWLDINEQPRVSGRLTMLMVGDVAGLRRKLPHLPTLGVDHT